MRPFLVACLALPCLLVAAGPEETQRQALQRLDQRLEVLRKAHHLPSLAVAVLHHQAVVFAKGYGFADLERRIPATPETPYWIASVTKPIASTLMLKLVEEGKLGLDVPLKDLWPGCTAEFERTRAYFQAHLPQLMGLISAYDFRRNDHTLRHHLSHTSEGVPGTTFHYNGMLYGRMSMAVDHVSPRDFETLVREDILQKLGMQDALPSRADASRPEVLKRLAVPYRWEDPKGHVASEDPGGDDVNAGAGIVASVRDLARFDMALDRDQLMSKASKAMAFTPHRLKDGTPIPYGLGWFIGAYGGHKVVYHTGWQPGAWSALYLKVPDADLTLLLLANGEELSAGFMPSLGSGRVEGSPFAKAFLELMVVPESPRDLPRKPVGRDGRSR